MIMRCPGCGGRNPRDVQSCEWCRRSFVKVPKRGLSARWWGIISAVVISLLLFTLAALAMLNVARPTLGRSSTVATASPPPLLPFTIASPSPSPSPTAAARPSPSPPPALVSEPPSPSPSPTAVLARYARVNNTGTLGLNIRREPATSAPSVAAVAEGGTVRLVGPEQRGADGRVWLQVEDARGNQGWVPAEFLVPLDSAPGG